VPAGLTRAQYEAIRAQDYQKKATRKERMEGESLEAWQARFQKGEVRRSISPLGSTTPFRSITSRAEARSCP
jgi:hypothetical protein